MQSKVSGMLSQEMDPIIKEVMVGPGLSDNFNRMFPQISKVNKAHVLMLSEQGILAASTAVPLAQAIAELESAGASSVTLDPSMEDPYFNYEAELISRAGPDIGGMVHVARSRNDLYSVIDRMRARDAIFTLASGLLELRDALVRQANRYKDIVMPGYTHMQPAQPLTFGYYLAGLAHAFERDQERLLQCLERFDSSPLGAGALAGTSFPIDRMTAANRLGFAGPTGHAQDSIASRDYILELLSVLSMTATNWGRMAQDFYVMTTYEFGTLGFPDSFALTSSMMPQKKNPTALELLKSTSAQILGAYVTGIASSKGSHFTLVLDACMYPFQWAWDSIDIANRALRLSLLVVENAIPNAPRMLSLSRENFSTATDLADMLVRDAGLNFRDAHHLVGAVVRAAMDIGINSDRIDAILIGDTAEKILGRRVEVEPDLVARAVDPVRAVNARSAVGGPAPESTARMVELLGASIERDRRYLEDRRDTLAHSEAALEADFEKLASSRPAA